MSILLLVGSTVGIFVGINVGIRVGSTLGIVVGTIVGSQKIKRAKFAEDVMTYFSNFTHIIQIYD